MILYSKCWVEYIHQTVLPALPESLHSVVENCDPDVFIYSYAGVMITLFLVTAMIIVRVSDQLRQRLDN